MKFRVKLAENIIEIESLHNRVYNMCKDYLVEDEANVAADAGCEAGIVAEIGEAAEADRAKAAADFCVTITQEVLEQERERSGNEGVYTDAYLETLAVYRQIAMAMVDRDTFLMHGAVFAIGDAACMITAPSGTGKTTFLRQMYKISDDAFIVNGDKPLIRVDKASDDIFAYGTPWSGKENLNTNCRVSLKMICILKRGEENSLEEIEFQEALPTLLSQTFRPDEAAGYIKTIGLLGELKDRVKFYNLSMKQYESAKDVETIAAELVKNKLENY